MSAVRIHEHKSGRTTQRPLSAAVLCTSLAVAAVCGLLALAPAIWATAESILHPQPSTLAQCEMVTGSAERLACFDRLGKQALQPPAKGALAPALTR